MIEVEEEEQLEEPHEAPLSGVFDKGGVSDKGDGEGSDAKEGSGQALEAVHSVVPEVQEVSSWTLALTSNPAFSPFRILGGAISPPSLTPTPNPDLKQDP